MGAVRPERRRRPLRAAQHLMEKAYEAILNRPGERKRRFLTASVAASQKRCGSAREQWFESVVQSPSAAQLVPLRSELGLAHNVLHQAAPALLGQNALAA